MPAYCRRTVFAWIGMGLTVAVMVVAQPIVEPPFLGPPDMHPNTLPGYVEIDGVPGQTGGDGLVYPSWWEEIPSLLLFENPWIPCSPGGEWEYVVTPTSSGAFDGVLDTFLDTGLNRTFQFDNFSGDLPLGGSLSYPSTGEDGTATLEESEPGQGFYDQIRLVGTNINMGNVNMVMPLVELDSDGDMEPDYIGVSDIGAMNAILETCEGASAATQAFFPLGRVDGVPALILDVDGDGSPDSEFLLGPPVRGQVGAGPSVIEIPSLSELGMVVLALTLLASALLFIKK